MGNALEDIPGGVMGAMMLRHALAHAGVIVSECLECGVFYNAKDAEGGMTGISHGICEAEECRVSARKLMGLA